MLTLRRGTVVATDPLTVDVDGEERRAWADTALLGEMEEGDEVIVNTAALDLELGSGGFDVVHVNLTRGLDGEGSPGAHVMKLNYTSLQQAVEPVEMPNGDSEELPELSRRPPVLILCLHGQLAPATWAASRRGTLRLGYVQTVGGALPGSLSRTVPKLRAENLLAGHVTAGPAYGGEAEAISVIGALHAAAERLEWDAIVAGPGPGIIGSATFLGHGGMAGLDTAHAALSLGLPTIVAPRASGADPRTRHRGISHHTESVLDLLLEPVQVPAPADVGAMAETLRELCGDRHVVSEGVADLDGFAESGLEARTMGRGAREDPEFFAAALAAGDVLARRAREEAS